MMDARWAARAARAMAAAMAADDQARETRALEALEARLLDGPPAGMVDADAPVDSDGRARKGRA